MGVRVQFDSNSVSERLTADKARAQKMLDTQVLKDSNYFCPMYTGTLQKSGILHTVIGSGRIVWQTPYARAQYYGLPHKSTTHNPNARCKWFEAAKEKNLKYWVDIVNGEYN